MSVKPSPAARPSSISEASTDYVAATTDFAVFGGRGRTLLTVTGRSPAQMLNGVITGVMPPVPSEVEPGVFEGAASYHTVLTPKGKIISDLRATLMGPEDTAGFLLDVPAAGQDSLLQHFKKFLPPRFARVTVASGVETDSRSGSDAEVTRSRITVVGSRAAEVLSTLAFGLRVDADWLREAEEGAWRCVGDPSRGLVVVRSAEVWPPAFDVYGPADGVEALRGKLLSSGGVEGRAEAWETLRVEAGRPAFGVDMDETTLPPEAGIADRAIDHGKGCYTGQEVIVRIRDRGHVNWELRRLDFGPESAPNPGVELTEPGSDKGAARVRSVVSSPRAGGYLALAYVRRGVEVVAFDGREVAVPEGFPTPL